MSLLINSVTSKKCSILISSIFFSTGTPTSVERVRTAAKAMVRLEEMAVAATAGRAVDVAVHHLLFTDKDLNTFDTKLLNFAHLDGSFLM